MSSEADIIVTLNGVDTGTYLVTTASGTRVLFDLDAKTMLRNPDASAGEAWTASADLDCDGEHVQFTAYTIQVDEPMRVNCAAPIYGYRSTPVRSIAAVAPPP